MDANSKRFWLPSLREHVRAGSQWAVMLGTDYWLQPSAPFDQAGAAATTTGDELAEVGWVATSLVNTAGSGADFGSAADKGTPNHFLTNADGDLLDSPAIFGSYDHMWGAMRLVNQKALPNILLAEFWGAMTVNSADELDSGWGFIEDGGTPITAADAIAMIYTNGANFGLQINGTLADLGAADDANWHLFKIELDRRRGEIAWFIDDAVQGRVASQPTGDEFPCSFGFAAGATNRPGLGLTRVAYDWR